MRECSPLPIERTRRGRNTTISPSAGVRNLTTLSGGRCSLSGNIIATQYRILSPLLRFVPLADLSRRARRLDRGEGFEDLVRVHSTFGHQPGVAGLEKYHLALQVQLGAALDHVADSLILARGLGHVSLLILEVAACSGWGSYPLPDRLQRSKLVRR